MKVLIISHNPITTYQNMGKTFLSLFSDFKKNELCQLYIYPTLPDIDICESYYRITDRDILKSYTNFGRIKSRVISGSDINTNQHSVYESQEDAEFFKKNKKNSITLLFRDIMWKFANWYNNGLKNWLMEQKPTCIFLAPGESKFIYDIALKIANRFNISIYMYICDEYYFVKTPKGIFNRLQLNLLKKKISKTMKQTEGLITICEELANAYSKGFGVNAKVIYTGTNYCIASESKLSHEMSGITYMGNLAFKRYQTIADIGREIDAINNNMGTEYYLFLYAKALNDEEKEAFSGIESVKYCGYVTGHDFEQILHDADALLHTESFDSCSIDRVKHSISTKIADIMGSGVPLFAYGPDNIASMRYLNKNKAAFCVTDKENLRDQLINLFNNFQEREEKVNQALLLAHKNHDAKINSKRLRNIFEGYYDESITN